MSRPEICCEKGNFEANRARFYGTRWSIFLSIALYISLIPTPRLVQRSFSVGKATEKAYSIYDDDPNYLIIDTPGLFSGIEIHDEKTKKYISEAHMILYISDAVNPLKDSHGETLRWLFNDLKKLPVTLFVINKMDEVADLDDEEDYERAAQIKNSALLATLQRFTEVKSCPKVICIAANPYGRGLAHWRSHPEEYERLSRIGRLHKAMDALVEDAGSSMRARVGLSVISETILSAVQEIESTKKVLVEERGLIEKNMKETQSEVKKLKRKANEKYNAIKEQVLTLRDGVFTSINSAADTGRLRNVISKDLGKDGYVLQERIEMIIRKESEELDSACELALKHIEESAAFYEAMGERMAKALGKLAGKAGVKLEKVPIQSLKTVIVTIRDFITKVTGTKIKFKPYGIEKLAARIKILGKFFKALPLIQESAETILKIYREETFNKERRKITNEVDSVFSEFLKEFTYEQFVDQSMPVLTGLEEVYQEIVASHDQTQLLITNLETGIAELKTVRV